MQEIINSFVEDTKEEICKLSRDIFSYAELANTETKSVKAIVEYVEKYGFKTQYYENYPTAFRSEWGSGSPVIGILAEYDALPGLNQAGKPSYDGNPSKSGHGCGHNLLGAGAAAGAVALKVAMEKNNIPGTVVLYGCPSEEICEGKIVMAHMGCFKELDIALSWHPNQRNYTGEESQQAMDSVQFSFVGITSHAAGKPHLGRSALDACELMNVGVNYLREHVTDDVRMHYSYVNAGDKPNVVPAFAKTWYYIRGKDRETVNQVTDRVIKIAQGAALMTETKLDYEFLSRSYSTLVNFTLCKLYQDVMEDIGAPKFDEDDIAFATELVKNVPDLGIEPRFKDDIEPMKNQIEYVFGSTDFSDVTQIVPASAFTTTCAPASTPLHHWSYTACAGSKVGEKGMLYAAKILAESAYRLYTDEDLVNKVKKEFADTSKGWWK